MYKSEELRIQKKKEAVNRARKKYDDKTYKKITVIVKKEVHEKVLLSDKFKNNNQYINQLIIEDLKRQGLLDNSDDINNSDTIQDGTDNIN